MTTLPVLILCCVSFLRPVQLLTLRTEENTERLDLINHLSDLNEDDQPSPPSLSPLPKSSSPRHPSSPGSTHRPIPASLSWAHPTTSTAPKKTLQKSPMVPLRMRRHLLNARGLHHYPQHAQLMRVGCVLGTCQVQNLSHRLYQLIGQSGREDSSPINPKSPHSYG